MKNIKINKLFDERGKLIATFYISLILTIIFFFALLITDHSLAMQIRSMTVLRVFLVVLLFCVLLFGSNIIENSIVNERVTQEVNRISKEIEQELRDKLKSEEIEFEAVEITMEDVVRAYVNSGKDIAKYLKLEKPLTPEQVDEICKILDKHKL